MMDLFSDSLATAIRRFIVYHRQALGTLLFVGHFGVERSLWDSGLETLPFVGLFGVKRSRWYSGLKTLPFLAHFGVERQWRYWLKLSSIRLDPIVKILGGGQRCGVCSA